MKRRYPWLAVTWLVVVHLAALLAGWLAPFDPTAQHREAVNQAPALLGTAGEPRFLLGSDELGRDQLSRLLFALRFSLSSSLAAAALALVTGTVAGVLAGWAGGWVDAVFLRMSELFLSLPWLYLLLAARAFLPLDLPPWQAVLLFAGFAGAVGWARPARLIRGAILTAREREYVEVARRLGAGPLYLLRNHVLPQLAPLFRAQTMLLLPKYVLAEATLSFLGLGISGAVPSLGGMLADLQHSATFGAAWWMYLPAAAMVSVFAAWQAVARISE